MANYKRYKIKIEAGGSSLNYSLRLNEDVYKNVGSALGISTASDSDNFNGIGGISDLRRAGKIVKVRASGRNSSGKSKSFTLWCAVSETNNAIGKLPSKKIGEYDIYSAGLVQTTRRR